MIYDLRFMIADLHNRWQTVAGEEGGVVKKAESREQKDVERKRAGSGLIFGPPGIQPDGRTSRKLRPAPFAQVAP